ncbi:MAG TPA: hybrid sensor histidine kinase/response regulator [Verrucomicrobia bacterium]|nr:hybrid sensor histidine kinase/response regulator [Verrucomicrobiota bacterium]HOP98573.1 hybrid sensor histidine kinase/response regulator [Verrucomicrobiota bacterium]
MSSVVPIESPGTDTDLARRPRRRGTLLVVDDEEGPRKSLAVIFKDEYDILMADNGPHAIELAQKHDIDVAILDIRMAGMSGIEVLERLKYVNPHIEVVMMTAFETTDTMRQAMRLRASDYINKPFDISTMRAAVANAMQRRTLESEINDNAEKLQELMAELQNQKIEEQIANTRGEIYASILHDINGPLTVISGFVQLMNQRFSNATRLEKEDLEFIKDRLKIINRQVTNCIEISRRYLSFLRRQTDEIPRVSINQLLTDLKHLINVHPSVQQNTFAVQPVAEDIGARMNGTDVIQILLNLTVNAFQCTSTPHHVEITGEVLHEPLDLTQFKDGPETRFLNVEGMANAAPLLKLSVRDNGPGIPADVLPRIFQPYFTTKGPRQGTGLGLNIVQRLVKEGKGALHLQTAPGRGTTFTVYLPAARLR